MGHLSTISTEDPQLIDQIQNLIKDEQAPYHLEKSENKSNENLDILPLTSEIAAIASSLRQAKKMTLGDAIIAATALVY